MQGSPLPTSGKPVAGANRATDERMSVRQKFDLTDWLEELRRQESPGRVDGSAICGVWESPALVAYVSAGNKRSGRTIHHQGYRPEGVVGLTASRRQKSDPQGTAIITQARGHVGAT